MFHSAFAGDISNRRLWRVFLCAAAAMLAVCLAHAENITICEEGCRYVNITAGIAAAKPGDTLEVHSGIYRENINVTKPIALLGINTEKGRPVVDASYKGSAIILSADGVKIDGFELRSALGNPYVEWAGILVTSNNNIISNNIAVDNDNGIYLSGFANNTILHNNATNNINGIWLNKSNSNKLGSNYLESNNLGLIVESSAGNILDGNHATNNDYGILLKSSEGNALKDNLMYENSYNFGADGINDVLLSNLVDNKPIYFLVRASGKIIDSSTRAGAVYCIDCTNVTIKDLIMENNQYGIFLSNTTHSELVNNRLTNNTYGIRLVSSPKNIIRNNEITNNLFDGLSLDSSNNNIIENNRAYKNHGYGLIILYSVDNSVITNNISINDNGMGINDSSNNLISRDLIESNINSGLLLRNASYNNISLNALNDSSRAVWLISSFKNYIERNGIFGNIDGITLEFSKNNTIIKNKIGSNRNGVLYDIGFDNIMSDNTMIGNAEDQIKLISTTTEQPPVRRVSPKSKGNKGKSGK